MDFFLLKLFKKVLFIEKASEGKGAWKFKVWGEMIDENFSLQLKITRIKLNRQILALTA